MNPRVRNVLAKSDFILELEFSNGEFRTFDVKPYLGVGVFQELKNTAYFQMVKVTNGTVAWPNNQDFCPDTLYLESQNCPPKSIQEKKKGFPIPSMHIRQTKSHQKATEPQ